MKNVNYKKKFLLGIGISSIVLSTSLFAVGINSVNDFTKYPLNKDMTSVSRGGTLPDKIALTDGVGTLLINSIATGKKTRDNKDYNKVLLANKDNIINNNKTLNQLITNNIINININANTMNKINNNGLVKIHYTHTNGSNCDDNNINTINDIWTNDVCSGTPVGLTRAELDTLISNYCVNADCSSHKANNSPEALAVINAKTGQITDMSNLFNGKSNFNLPIGNWNTSNVTNMGQMFERAYFFNQPLNNWNVSKVTNMNWMFSYFTSFNQNINNWNVSNVTNMSYMFYSATSFNQPLNNWNVGNVINMQGMFNNVINFNQPLNNVSYYYPFRNLSALTSANSPL